MAKAKLYPKSAKEIKGKTAIAELQRAHLIIGLLSFAIIPIFIIGALAPIQYPVGLAVVAIILLLLLGGASIGTIFALKRK